MKTRPQLAVAVAVVAAALAGAGALRAFPNVTNWELDASADLHAGGGGIWATGGARDWGIHCAHCHVNDKDQQGNLAVQVSWSPALGSGDTYVAGQTYQVTLKMVPAAVELGASSPNNKNGFTATIEDAAGETAGSFRGDLQSFAAPCPSMPTLPGGGSPMPDPGITPANTSFAYDDCHVVGSVGKYQPALSQWTFQWQAPATADQPLTVFYAVVDGDGDQRSFGDDVKIGKIQLH